MTHSADRPPRKGYFGRAVFLLILIAVLPVALIMTFSPPVPLFAGVALGYVVQLVVVVAVSLRLRAKPRDPWVWIALLYGISQLVTLAVSNLRFGALEYMDLINAVSKSVGVLMFAGLAQAVATTNRGIEVLLRGIVGLALVSVVVNLVLNIGELGSLSAEQSSYTVSFSSFFGNRNQYGSFLFLSIVAHALLLTLRGARWVTPLVFAAQIASLILTMSRGALAATVVFFLAFTIFRFVKRPGHLVRLALLGLLAAGVIYYSGAVKAVNDLFVREDSGLSGRDELWSTGLHIWSTNDVLFGVGTFRGQQIAESLGMEFSEFHSFYVETLVSGGVVEFGLLMAIFAFVAFGIVPRTPESAVRHGLYAGGLAISALSMFESISFFTIGFVGTIFTVFVVTLPIMLANRTPSETPPEASASGSGSSALDGGDRAGLSRGSWNSHPDR